MQRLLIAESSEVFARILEERLCSDLEVRVCHDGSDALALLQSFRPDALILNLQLPMKDGLTVLRQSAFVPRVILGIVGFGSPYIQRTAYALGVSQLVLMPTANSLTVSLMDLMQHANDPDRKPDLREQARVHLQTLNFYPHRDGYKQLSVGLPLFAADTHQGLTKELYPAIADALGYSDWRAVEKSIHRAICNAWDARDPQVWAKYFPDGTCPNNKHFLSRLAELMEI